MPMISYAQNREDVLLARVFPPGIPGFYVDVGASHPVDWSVTKHFYDRGWRGVNIEPATGSFAELAAARPRDVNLNVGVSDEEGTLTFYEIQPPLSGASTFCAAQAEWHRETGLSFAERSVPVTTLAKVCEAHIDETIDFMSIDVEGFERPALEGADWQRFRPRVVLVEATQPRTTVPTHDQWEPVLLKADYQFAAFDGLNRYYVRAEDAELATALATPVNVLDDYVPYEYSKQIEHYRWAFEAVNGQLSATQAAYQSLLAEFSYYAPSLSVLRADYERLERALTNTRAELEAVRGALAEARQLYEQLQPEVVTVRERTEAAHALFESIGPGGLGVARRVTQLSARHPRAGRTFKRGLRAALAVKRRLGSAGS